MKLDTEFIKLPLRFDVERLAQEVSAFPEADWKPHPQGYPGNSAISLIAVNGDPGSDSVKGPMSPTSFLERCPYLRQVLGAFETVLGRSRLMRIAGQGEVTAHIDVSYYWLQRVRIHVPIITYPEVEFYCGEKIVNMAAGECWLFDTWQTHKVLNHVPHPRIHLVVDTVGSAPFWELVARGERPFAPSAAKPETARLVSFEPDGVVKLNFEQVNSPVVMSPWEQTCLLNSFLEDLVIPKKNPQVVDQLKTMLRRFQHQWHELWARFGTDSSGFPEYQEALDQFRARLKEFDGKLELKNGLGVSETIRQGIVRPALNPELAPPPPSVQVEVPPGYLDVKGQVFPAPPTIHTPRQGHWFERPIIIVAAPRSGSTLLFETLARSPGVWTVGGESHGVFERIARLNPEHRGFDSNRLTEVDADPQTANTLRNNFLARLRNRDGQPLPDVMTPIRLLEKTPKNALRILFLNAVFPDARFIYLFREPPENVSSILEAWRSGRFVTYPKLPGWQGSPWSLLLIPNWRDLIGKELAEIATEQYAVTHQQIMGDLGRLPKERWTTVTYADLVADPQTVAERLCAFADIPWDQHLEAGKLPLSRHTLTPPDPNKWRKNAAILERVLPRAETVAESIRKMMGTAAPESVSPVATPAVAPLPPVPAPLPPASGDGGAVLIQATAPMKSLYADSEEPAMPDQPAPAANAPPKIADLRSIHTNNFPKILEQLGISLAVTTYQAGKLILVRSDGGKLNTHFRSFSMPMGLALERRRLVVGTKLHVWEFRNQPEAGRKLEPAGKHDACFLPRSSHVTGDIRIHELAFAKKELWIVNTRFSCLCTLDREHSFVPRWRPPFVTALTPEDRCHLNGLAVVDGRPKYVTVLGMTDKEAGWRENKAHGGCLVDVESGKAVLEGLSMPHSPRWYRNQLWVLESGDGSIGRVDIKKRKMETLAQMPGFTRGIDFYGDFAFIGLSQVRETAVFSDIPITERLQERTCGVWVIDLRNGKTVAYLRFEAGVQEIFAVQVLPSIRFPDLINEDETLLANSFMLPKEALSQVPVAVLG